MKIRSLSPATIIASIALFVSLTGTAVAGVMITGANVVNGSLTGLDVKTNSLGSVDVMNNTLGTVDVKNGSLLPIDFKGGLPAGAQGPAGAPGPAGPQGPAGSQGQAGVSGYEVVSESRTVNAPFVGKSLTTSASCPKGKVVVGGAGLVQLYDDDGFLGLGSIAALQVVAGEQRPRSWSVNVDPPSAGATRAVVTARAFCVSVI